MEKPFFEFDLTKESSLIEELDKMYEFCNETHRYTKLIFRAPFSEFPDLFPDYEKTSTKFFSSYDKLLIDYQQISDWISLNRDKQIGQFSLYGESLNWDEYPNTYDFIFSKILEIYGSDIIIKILNKNQFSIKKFNIDNPLLTMYKKNGILMKHTDGKSITMEREKIIKPANILLYLNKNYDTKIGGNFVVDGQTVSPEFGKLVFLNFRGDSDPEHEVSVLNEDVNRIALLFSVTYRNNNTKEICKIPKNFVY
jgi:hypothetical protein